MCPQIYVNMCHLMSNTLARKQQPTEFWFHFDIFAVKGLYQKLPFLLLCFHPEMKKGQIILYNEMFQES